MGCNVCNTTQTFQEVKIYLFSGLGADERLFDQLTPLEGYEYVAIKYLKPSGSKTLSDYAQLLVDTYRFEQPFILGGVSIGGMIAQEIAEIIRPEKLILISTVRFTSEFPVFLRMVNNGFARILIKKPLLEMLAAVADRFTKKSNLGRKLFYDMLHDSDADFMKFGARAALSWHPPVTDIPVIRFHGSKDKVFPISRIKRCIEIKDGSHFMIFDRGVEISQVLRTRLVT